LFNIYVDCPSEAFTQSDLGGHDIVRGVYFGSESESESESEMV